MKTRFLRARYLLPMADSLGRDTRISDGYVLWKDDAILELGAFDEAVGQRLLAAHGDDLEVVEQQRPLVQEGSIVGDTGEYDSRRSASQPIAGRLAPR